MQSGGADVVQNEPVCFGMFEVGILWESTGHGREDCYKRRLRDMKLWLHKKERAKCRIVKSISPCSQVLTFSAYLCLIYLVLGNNVLNANSYFRYTSVRKVLQYVISFVSF